MDRATEIALMKEICGLKENKHFYLDDQVEHSPVSRYVSPERFADEQEHIFRKAPLIAAHSSEIPETGSFLTRDLAGLPLLLTRDKAGEVHAFLNVCRHRGSRLEQAATGCKRIFSCPYHAWSWSNDGKLRGVPHQKQGFPDLDKSTLGLKRLPVLEAAGLVWVIADPDSKRPIGDFIAPVLDDLAWCGMPDLAIAAEDFMTVDANWKLLVEGGIEAYHFKVAHRNTIGPHFLDNLSSYQMLGSHMRSVLPKNSLVGLDSSEEDSWRIRAHTNVLYSLFPLNQFLLMEDHIAWISARPLAYNRAELRLVTLAPTAQITPENAAHWTRNHAITVTTLTEDFEVNAGAQAGMESGANDTLLFGRFEGALHAFNSEVDAWCDEGGDRIHRKIKRQLNMHSKRDL